MSSPPESLDDTLSRRLGEILAGAAATEGELRRLTERGEAHARVLRASLQASESRLGALAFDPDAEVAAMAHELRRGERLREELDDVEAALVALRRRARTLRGQWLRQR
jgi:hypothetical protein